MTYATRIPHTGTPVSYTLRATYRISYAHGRDMADGRHADRYLMLREYADTLSMSGHPLADDVHQTMAFGLVDGHRETAARGDQVNAHLTGGR